MNIVFKMIILIVLVLCFVGLVLVEEIIFVFQGGVYQEVQIKVIFDFVIEVIGIIIKQDSSFDVWFVLCIQIVIGKLIWDVIDIFIKDCICGGEQGMIEFLDMVNMFNVVVMFEELCDQWLVVYEFYFSVLVYNVDVYGDNLFKIWVDFWDVKKFFGICVLCNYLLVMFEVVLMVDGVDFKDMYLMDVDCVFKKFEEIKFYISVWWILGV